MAKKQNKKIQKITTPARAVEGKIAAKKYEAHRKGFSITLKLGILLGLLSFAVYANTLKNGYALDDYQVIKENKIVTKGITAIPEILSTPYRQGIGHVSNDLYRPLSLVMFAVEYQFFGNHTMPYHCINILLFAGCVILLFLFLNELFEQKNTAVAFTASLLFALHPIHTEVVANIKSCDELLCFFFSFLSLNVFIKYMHTGKMNQLLLGFLFFLLSFLSKETVITFLALIPLVFFFYIANNKKRSINITLSIVFATIICLIARVLVLSHYNSNHFSYIEFIDNALAKQGLPIDSRIATAIFILGYYIKLLLIPYPLISDYSYNSISFVNFSDPWVLISLSVYVFLAVFSVRRFLKNHKDNYAFAILFFLITLSIFSNILFLIGTTMGERLLFFPSVGFCLSLALVIKKIAGEQIESVIVFFKKPVVLGIIIPVAFFYTFITINRNSDWLDSYTLYSTDLKKRPDNSRLNSFVGIKMQDYIINEEKDPVKQKQLNVESIAYIRKAITIYPEYRDALANLGYVYLLNSQYDSAEVYLKSALKITQSNIVVLSNLAQTYVKIKKYTQAMDLLKKVIVLSPDNDNAYTMIASVFFENGQFDSAEVYDLHALRLSPNNTGAINNLGSIYAVRKNFRQAIDMYKKIIELNTDFINTYTNIGVCYLYLPKYDSAIYYANKAISINHSQISSFQVLAAAYKALGNPDSAKKYEAIVQKGNY